MNKTFGWTEWDKHLLHLRGKPVRILEIGVYKGEAMEKFAQVFLESNSEAEYYGIDTWEGSPEYIEIDFKEIEKAALDRKEASPRKNNIHFIKKESVIALPELIIKKIIFDIIYIDASHVAKDVLYDSTLSMKLLNINGIVIFDDYLWQKLEPVIFTPKPAIDSILNIFKDELNVLYMGYQVIAKKVNLKFLPKQTDRTIIDGFISLLDKYWYDNNFNDTILFNLKEIPNIKPKFSNFEDIKSRQLSGIEIFKKLNNEFLMYKYCEFSNIKNELKNKEKTPNLDKIFGASDLNKYRLFNFINMKKNKTDNDTDKAYRSNVSLTKIMYDRNKKEQDSIQQDKFRYKVLANIDQNKTIQYINLCYILDNKSMVDDLLTKYKKHNKKTEQFLGVYWVMYPEMTKSYNYILLQILLLQHTLEIGGEFHIAGNSIIINDLLILLNHIFDKIKIRMTSKKIGSLELSITGINFLGINDSLYNKIYDIITTTDKEIISIFDKEINYSYINIEISENKIFDMTKKIISILQKNEKLILLNIDKINMAQRKRTLNDVMKYLL